jgi:hypothetical protein
MQCALIIAYHLTFCGQRELQQANVAAWNYISTKEDDISFTREGDFCLKNSGHLLCKKLALDICDKCDDLKDFNCACGEYNAIKVPLKGFGNECSEGMMLSNSLLLGLAYLAAAFFLF